MQYLASLNETDLTELFSPAHSIPVPAALALPQRRESTGNSLIRSLGAIVAAGLVCGIITGNFFSPQQTEVTQAAPAIVTESPTPAPEPSVTPEPVIEPTVALNSIGYGDVAIAAPIRWNIAFTGDRVDRELELGVVHIEGTAVAGQQGTVVLFGHSSSQPWSRSPYKSVFASLHDAAPDQIIEINRDNVAYRYKVTKKYEVQPTQLEVLDPAAVPTLRLITCTPVGTSLRRLVIEAEQISPNPAKNTPFTPVRFTNQLPGD
jgi:LPXTG-site transpeptidase (sortase) family protein